MADQIMLKVLSGVSGVIGRARDFGLKINS